MDVSIRGAGIFGLCTAWACVKAGATVEIVDPGGVAAGASGGIVGALAPHVPENWNPKKQFQFESLILADSFWSEVASAGGDDPGYRLAGRVQPVATGGEALARARAVSAADLWRGKAVWEVVSNAAGWSVQSPTGLFIRDSLSAHIHPRKACYALAAALAARSVSVVPEPDATAGATLWATGAAGLDALNKVAKRAMGGAIKGQAALLNVNRVGLPQLFADSLHIIPHVDGTVAVGSTTERIFSSATNTDAQLDAVLERACVAVPELRGAEVIGRWAGLRPRARTRAPMLGQWPDCPGHFIANGGFKIGFGMAPKVGQVMARLILEGRNEIPEGFDVTDSL